MEKILLTDKQMRQAYEQLAYFHDAGYFQTTLALEDDDKYVEIDVDGYSELAFGFTDYTGYTPVTGNDQSLDVTGVRNYNPDLDILEDACMDAMQYNELQNSFVYETSNF